MPGIGCNVLVPNPQEIATVGLAIGVLYGLFGVGSAFATPLLAAIGVPGLAAVVAPLPALLPGSAAGAWAYAREGRVDTTTARRAVAGGAPAAIAGSLLSQHVGGTVLVLASGLVLLVVGARLLRPGAADEDGEVRAASRRDDARLVIGVAAAVGFTAGLLANGGGFLLVPLFIVFFGLAVPEATGTSLTVALALTVPTFVTHLLMGDVAWAVTLPFTVGLVPGTVAGSRLAAHLPAEHLRVPLGLLIVAFASWFLTRELGLLG